MVLVRGGCFDMGDHTGTGQADELPVHNVCLADYYISSHEVTQGQWQSVMGQNPSEFQGCDDCPVEKVSFEDVTEFLKKLNAAEDGGYRLPTEAEWEFAATSRGKKERFAGTSDPASLSKYAWYAENSGEKTHPVGEKLPNELGLYDMTGNVWEWLSDNYASDYYSKSKSLNPPGPMPTGFRSTRGGSWYDIAERVRIANRGGNKDRVWFSIVGLRLAKDGKSKK